MKKIGVTLSIPSLDNLLKEFRNKYDKYSHLEPHMTIYLSDYIEHKNVEELAKMLQVYTRKVVIDKIVGHGKIIFLNIQNWKDFDELKEKSIETFGKEKYKSNYHITLGYNIPNYEFIKIKNKLQKHFPIKVEGSSYKIVLMKDNEAKEFYITPI